MTAAAEALLKTGGKCHTVVQIGLADSVPLKIFERVGLDNKRTSHTEFVEEPFSRSEPHSNHPQIFASPSPVEPITLVGMACRAPGVDNVEEL